MVVAATAPSGDKPRLLFVDDEQRVLNSMRIMFKRDYDLFLASRGAEALSIIKDNDIDVIIADHRMPQMTGVEVLTAVRSLSPRTVRILLTGYADLNAIEGSINDSEVFRFLTKPCAPKDLRSTIQMATEVARDFSNNDDLDFADDDEDAVEIVLESPPEAPEVSLEELRQGGRSQPEPAAVAEPEPAAPPAPTAPTAPEAPPVQAETESDSGSSTAEIEQPEFESTAVIAEAPEPPPVEAAPTPSAGTTTGLGIVVFSDDQEVVDIIQQAVRGRLPVYHATNIVKVVKILGDHRPGVLVTDITTDRATIQSMTAQLKEHLPELVTVAISAHRDVLDMVWLINHGQIFRFLRKPLSPGRCAVSLQAALKHHRMLLKRPDLIKRHEVNRVSGGGLVDTIVEKIRAVREMWTKP